MGKSQKKGDYLQIVEDEDKDKSFESFGSVIVPQSEMSNSTH